MEDNSISARLKLLAKGNLGIPALLLVVLAMVTLPIPSILLDVAFTFNIALSIIVLLVAIYALKPLDFAVFPTILLAATLLRLALNVASTRVVLLDGHEGGDAAGKVIEAFGDVVVGGNYFVGIIVFAILVIINFVVVTKGAGRISEVSARFTLDALPGKQMAIDADLNSGLIDQDQARTRRAEVSQEADFYGAMDGASKFVKGDAIAGIMILIINLLGGLAVGMIQHDLDFSRAIEFYSLLTIGDGLVAQIPSLLLSTAAAVMVTRANSAQEISDQVFSQMFYSSRALYIAGSVLIIMGLVPGMPHLAFIGLGLGCIAIGYYIDQKQKADLDKIEEDDAEEVEASDGLDGEVEWQDILTVDKIGLEVGYRLISMVDKEQGGVLLKRIKGIRKKISQDLGFLIPAVHVRDNLELQPGQYRITMMGVTLGESEVYPDRDLAINPGTVFGEIPGIHVKEPSFGLDAFWIERHLKEKAHTLGYTVADPSTVIATHLNDILHTHSSELLGHEIVQELLDMMSDTSPKLVEEVVPKKISASILLKVLQNLLSEGVPIKDFHTIIESIAEASTRVQDPASLTAAVRLSLSRLIMQTINGTNTEVPVITLDPMVEQMVINSVKQGATGEDGLMIEPNLAEQLQMSLDRAASEQEANGRPSILLVSSMIRPMMAKFVRYGGRQINVLSYQEVPDNKRVTIVATVGSN